MAPHRLRILVHLIAKLKKRDKIRGLSNIITFSKKINNFNDTNAKCLEFIYFITLYLL